MQKIKVDLSENQVSKIRRAFNNNEYAIIRLNADDLGGLKYNINISPLLYKKVLKAREKEVGLTLEINPEMQTKIFIQSLTKGLARVPKGIQKMLGNGIYNPGDNRRQNGRGEIDEVNEVIDNQIDDNIDAGYNAAKNIAVGAAATFGIPPALANEALEMVDGVIAPVINTVKYGAKKAIREVEKGVETGAKEVGKFAKNTGKAIGNSAKKTGRAIKKSAKRTGRKIRKFFGFGLNGERLYMCGNGIVEDESGNPYNEQGIVMMDKNGNQKILPVARKVKTIGKKKMHLM